MQILLNINRDGTTIMLVTHDVKVAAKTERILFMADGEIVSEIQLGKLRNDDLKAREEVVKLVSCTWILKRKTPIECRSFFFVLKF